MPITWIRSSSVVVFTHDCHVITTPPPSPTQPPSSFVHTRLTHCRLSICSSNLKTTMGDVFHLEVQIERR